MKVEGLLGPVHRPHHSTVMGGETVRPSHNALLLLKSAFACRKIARIVTLIGWPWPDLGKPTQEGRPKVTARTQHSPGSKRTVDGVFFAYAITLFCATVVFPSAHVISKLKVPSPHELPSMKSSRGRRERFSITTGNWSSIPFRLILLDLKSAAVEWALP